MLTATQALGSHGQTVGSVSPGGHWVPFQLASQGPVTRQGHGGQTTQRSPFRCISGVLRGVIMDSLSLSFLVTSHPWQPSFLPPEHPWMLWTEPFVETEIAMHPYHGVGSAEEGMCQPRGHSQAADSVKVRTQTLAFPAPTWRIFSAATIELPTLGLRSTSGPFPVHALFQLGSLPQTSLPRVPTGHCFQCPPHSLSALEAVALAPASP